VSPPLGRCAVALQLREEALQEALVAMDLYLSTLREEDKEAPKLRRRRHLPA
jgi:predicted RNase H-like HicB family nuclease